MGILDRKNLPSNGAHNILSMFNNMLYFIRMAREKRKFAIFQYKIFCMFHFFYLYKRCFMSILTEAFSVRRSMLRPGNPP